MTYDLLPNHIFFRMLWNFSRILFDRPTLPKFRDIISAKHILEGDFNRGGITNLLFKQIGWGPTSSDPKIHLDVSLSAAESWKTTQWHMFRPGENRCWYFDLRLCIGSNRSRFSWGINYYHPNSPAGPPIRSRYLTYKNFHRRWRSDDFPPQLPTFQLLLWVVWKEWFDVFQQIFISYI